MAFNVLDTVAVGAAAGAAGVTLANQSPKLIEAQEPFIKFQFPQTVSSVERFCGCCGCGFCGRWGCCGVPLFAAPTPPPTAQYPSVPGRNMPVLFGRIA
jgi:hypothetical protein